MAQLVVLSLVILLLILEVVISFSINQAETDYDIFKRRYDICHLPVQPGNCRHGVKSWHYDYVTKKCNRFIYTLCGGNANRFYTKEECMSYCNNYKYVFEVETDEENSRI